MCYDRRSFASDSRKAADTEEAKQNEAKRTEAVETLLRDAREGATKESPAEAPVKEAAPAK